MPYDTKSLLSQEQTVTEGSSTCYSTGSIANCDGIMPSDRPTEDSSLRNQNMEMAMKQKKYAVNCYNRTSQLRSVQAKSVRTASTEKSQRSNDRGKYIAMRNILAKYKRYAGNIRYRCDFESCEKSFCSKLLLTCHMRMHEGILPYMCFKCVECFTFKRSVILHIREHTKKYLKLLICNTCGSCYDRKCSLIMHRRAHLRDMPFHCGVCGKSFDYERSLIAHQSTHETVKLFSCHMCNKRFFRKGALRVHIQRHLSMKQHQCTQCEKSYITPSDLQRHILSHLYTPPYSCGKCSRIFKMKCHLRRHQKQKKSCV